MPSSIVLTGLASNNPTPGTYIEVSFAQGPAAGGTSKRPGLLIGNFLTTGTATAATIYGPDTSPACQTESDVVNLFGAGSELHRMFLKWTSVNRSTALYFVTVAQSAGASAALTFTLLTVPTGNGNWRIYLDDEFVDVAVASGATLSSLTSAAATAINAQSRWAVTAAQATVTTSNDSVTLTAKQKGPRGNWLNGQAYITAGIGTTTTNTTRAYFSGGTTADSNTNALSAIAQSNFYYQVSAAEDATQYGALVTQINTMAQPITGIRQRAFAGSVDTLANATTIATGINAARAELVWQKTGDWTPAELAAHNAGLYSIFENVGTRPRNNFSGFGNGPNDAPYWKIPGPRNGTTPTAAEITSALNNGITPIGRNTNGSSYLVKRVTSRSLNGSVNDYRIRDAHKVTICDFFADDAYVTVSTQFQGKDLMDDFKQGQPPPAGQVVTPRLFGNAILQLLDIYASNSLLQNVGVTKANAVFQRETSPSTRLSGLVGLFPIDIADQFSLELQQLA